MARRKRVLIVNCYWPETRVPMQLPNEMPMPLAPVHLAGHFAPHRWEIRLYNEVANGHLELFAADLLKWPDVVVFCGLTAAFDRFLHLSAYFRTRNPSVVVIAGGLAVRLLPGHASTVFDYACRGDVEEIREVITDAFGAEFVADDPVPRYDLAHGMGRWIGYAESSRNCNFRCSFCTLTADALPWRVGLGLANWRPVSWATLVLGHSASFRPDCKSKNATAPWSNSVPTMPLVRRPSPSR